MRQASKLDVPVVDLGAKALATESAAIGSSALRQEHPLNARDLATKSAPELGTGPKEQAFVKRLEPIVSASPDQRTVSQDALIKIGIAEFGLSKRRAKRLFDGVLDRLGASAWRLPGRPKRPRS